MEMLVAYATISIREPSGAESAIEIGDRISIYPERISLAPGETTRLRILGVGIGSERPALEVQWQLDPDLGEIAPFSGSSEGSVYGAIRANGAAGIYPSALRATVSLESNGGTLTREIFADLVIRGPLATVTIIPVNVSMIPGQWVQFHAQARDDAGTLLPDVTFGWSLLDDHAGKLDPVGLFRAGEQLGEYREVVAVRAIQRTRDMP